MAYYEYPHTRNYDQDLGYIIKQLDAVPYLLEKAITPVITSVVTTQEILNDSLLWLDNTLYISTKDIAQGETLKESVNIKKITVEEYIKTHGGGTSIDVINNLASTSATDALSANQGRVLNEKATTNATNITNLKIETSELTQDIADNSEKIATNTSDIKTINTSLTNKASVTDLQAVNTLVTTNTNDIQVLKNTTVTTDAFNTLETTVDTNTANINANATEIINVKNNIETLSDTVDTKADKTTLNDYVTNTNFYGTITELTNEIADKQPTLESGVNIKTINNNSLLGSGNITISGGSGNVIDSLESESATDALSANQGRVLNENKQDTLVSGTNIKYLRNGSATNYYDLLTSGNSLVTLSATPNSYARVARLLINNTYRNILGNSSISLYPFEIVNIGENNNTWYVREYSQYKDETKYRYTFLVFDNSNGLQYIVRSDKGQVAEAFEDNDGIIHILDENNWTNYIPLQNYIPTTNISNVLTDKSSNNVLSAQQGYYLKEQFDSITTRIINNENYLNKVNALYYDSGYNNNYAHENIEISTPTSAILTTSTNGRIFDTQGVFYVNITGNGRFYFNIPSELEPNNIYYNDLPYPIYIHAGWCVINANTDNENAIHVYVCKPDADTPWRYTGIATETGYGKLTVNY